MKIHLTPALRRSLLAAVLALPGCTMMPRYERPTAPVPAQYPRLAEAGARPAEAEIAWREFLAERRLRQLVELALAGNRDLRVALLKVDQARAQYRITRSASFPSVDASGSLSRSHRSGATTEQWSASVGTTSYEVDLFGRVRSLNAQALERYFATEEARRGVQVSLVAEVASQYFALRRAEEQLQLARQTLTAVLESYDLTKATFDAGATSELDVRSAEGQVQTARISVLNVERDIAQAGHALVLLVGQTLPAELPAPAPFTDPSLLAPIPVGLPSDIVLRRPDILRAEHTLRAANANIGAARAAFLPSIRLTGSIGTASEEFSQLLGSGSGIWSFVGQLTAPIFNAGQNRANLALAQVSERIEVANYEKAIQTAFREVADALAATSSYASQVEERAALITTQQRRLDLALARYRHGEDSYLNVLTAQQDLYSAQQGRIDAQYNRLASQIGLYKALGGGWQ